MPLCKFCGDPVAPDRLARVLLQLPCTMWGGATGCSVLHKTPIVLIFTGETIPHCLVRLFLSSETIYLHFLGVYLIDIGGGPQHVSPCPSGDFPCSKVLFSMVQT